MARTPSPLAHKPGSHTSPAPGTSHQTNSSELPGSPTQGSAGRQLPLPEPEGERGATTWTRIPGRQLSSATLSTSRGSLRKARTDRPSETLSSARQTPSASPAYRWAPGRTPAPRQAPSCPSAPRPGRRHAQWRRPARTPPGHEWPVAGAVADRPPTQGPRARAGAPAARACGGARLPASRRRPGPKAARRRPRRTCPGPRPSPRARAPAARPPGRPRPRPAPGRASPAVAALRGLQREVHARGPREGQQHLGDVELGRQRAGAQRQQPREQEQQRPQRPAPSRHPSRASPLATRCPAARALPSRPPSPVARARPAGDKRGREWGGARAAALGHFLGPGGT